MVGVRDRGVEVSLNGGEDVGEFGGGGGGDADGSQRSARYSGTKRDAN